MPVYNTHIYNFLSAYVEVFHYAIWSAHNKMINNDKKESFHR